ncbi:MAG: hypothetical protein FJZ13_00765 [Candidatus Omnitrophica bacterium]|nr:hypothetical protein [Candidatus Omnitrophota bacterium]
MRNFLDAIEASATTRKAALELAERLVDNDPYKLTEFEVSFKLKGDRLIEGARFLHFDYNLYSCVNPYLFKKRVGLFKDIVTGKVSNKSVAGVFDYLDGISKTPVDLYFGCDVNGKQYLFAFWLILAGVNSKKEISVNPNARAIFKKAVLDLGLKINMSRKQILNIGFDLGTKEAFLKTYYFYNDSLILNKRFAAILESAKKLFDGYQYFVFLSDKFNHKSQNVFQKLYFEFLDNASVSNKESAKMLNLILKVCGSPFDARRLRSIISGTGGRISIIAFGSDSSLTFYIRPC